MTYDLVFSEPPKTTRIVFSSEEGILSGTERGLGVCDTNTCSLFHQPDEFPLMVLPSGEPEKNFTSVEKILREAVSLGLSRDSVFFGVGGGVICDMTAFAASVYMRGCPLVLVPTTLLAMVDAALGGKTGVDYCGYKNLAGTFYPADEVRISPGVLASLPEIEYTNGLAEVIKYALLGEGDILRLLETHHSEIIARDGTVLEEIIMKSVIMKAGYIEQDPLERGIRTHLNLGHTFAHALESLAGFRDWPHGRAVAWGILKALQLGRVLGMTPESYVGYVRDILGGFAFDLDFRFPETRRAEYIEAMRHDKKNRSGALRFVLQTGLAETVIQEVDEESVLEVLK